MKQQELTLAEKVTLRGILQKEMENTKFIADSKSDIVRNFSIEKSAELESIYKKLCNL